MDEILIRAGIFQGVEPHAAEALAQALEPAEFPRGHVIFAEGEPGDRLYIVGSGKVKIGSQAGTITVRAGDKTNYDEVKITITPAPAAKPTAAGDGDGAAEPAAEPVSP